MPIPLSAEATLLQSWSGACLVRGSLEEAVRHYLSMPSVERVRVDRLECECAISPDDSATRDYLLPVEIRRLAEFLPENAN